MYFVARKHFGSFKSFKYGRSLFEGESAKDEAITITIQIVKEEQQETSLRVIYNHQTIENCITVLWWGRSTLLNFELNLASFLFDNYGPKELELCTASAITSRKVKKYM